MTDIRSTSFKASKERRLSVVKEARTLFSRGYKRSDNPTVQRNHFIDCLLLAEWMDEVGTEYTETANLPPKSK